MILTRGRLGPPVLVAAMLLLGSACSSSNDREASGATTAAPTTAAPTASSTSKRPTDSTASGSPKVGDCLEPMTQSMSNSVQLPAIVSCDLPHGGEVVSVLTFTTATGGDYPASSGRVEGARNQLDQCTGTGDVKGDLAKFLGSTPLDLSADEVAHGASDAYIVSGIQYGVFVPGPAAWSAGDRWFACAAVLSNSVKTPSSYTGSLRDALKTPGKLNVQFSWCKQQPPDSRGTFTVVPCSEPHNYEQLAAFTAGPGDTAYPGDPALAELSSTACPSLSSQATAKASEDLPKGIALGWTYPLENEWANGDRSVRCFAVTETSESTGSVADGTAKVTGG